MTCVNERQAGYGLVRRTSLNRRTHPELCHSLTRISHSRDIQISILRPFRARTDSPTRNGFARRDDHRLGQPDTRRAAWLPGREAVHCGGA